MTLNPAFPPPALEKCPESHPGGGSPLLQAADQGQRHRRRVRCGQDRVHVQPRVLQGRAAHTLRRPARWLQRPGCASNLKCSCNRQCSVITLVVVWLVTTSGSTFFCPQNHLAHCSNRTQAQPASFALPWCLPRSPTMRTSSRRTSLPSNSASPLGTGRCSSSP